MAVSESSGVSSPFERAFDIFGVRVAVGAPTGDLLDRIAALLPPGLPRCEPEAAESRYVLTEVDEGQWRYLGPQGPSWTYTDLTLVLALLDSDLSTHVAASATNRVFVHAGAVAYRGHAIVIPGGSFSGKTTLVAELVRGGAVYYSDEHAVLDERGLVHPYARPLSIRRPPPEGRDSSSAESLGGRTGVEPVPVGLIVATKYRPEASFSPERRSAAQGILALLAQAGGAAEQPRETMSVVRQAASSAVVLEGERGEAAAAAQILLRIAAEAVENGTGPHL